MKTHVTKRAKAIFASAMAMTLAIPSVSFLSNVKTVEAAASLPNPVAVYNFDDVAAENVTIVDNGVAPSVVDATYGDRSSKALELKTNVVTPEVVEIVETGEEKDGKPVTKESVVSEAEYVFSEATVNNPFAGMTDLIEEPTFSGSTKMPVWNTGVTISYWQKAASEDSSVISFTNQREGIIHKDSRDKYLLFKQFDEDPNNEIFAMGEAISFEYESKMKLNDVTVKASLAKGTYTILSGCGAFVRFNKNYTGKDKQGNTLYYLRPTVKSDGTITGYNLEEIGTPFEAAKFSDPKAEGTELESGTAEGGLQLNSSGAWGYLESKETSLYKGSVYSSTRSVDNGNRAAAYTKIADTYQEESPVNSAGEWLYITRVIKNDSIATYINGVLKDEELYTTLYDTGLKKDYNIKKGFNLGWGYYSSAGDGGIKVQYGGADIMKNNSAIAIQPNGTLEMPDGTLGHNGNTLGMTIMQMLVDENTTLSFGGQTPGIKEILLETTGTTEGTAIDNVAFFAEPLDEDQVAELYARAQKRDIILSEKDENPATQEPVQTGDPVQTDNPNETQAPDSSDNPNETQAPDSSKAPDASDAPSVSQNPDSSQAPVPAGDILLGDVTGDKEIDLNDVQMVLAAYLGEELADSARQAADVNKDGDVDLTDAQMILQYYLGDITEF